MTFKTFTLMEITWEVTRKKKRVLNHQSCTQNATRTWPTILQSTIWIGMDIIVGKYNNS